MILSGASQVKARAIDLPTIKGAGGGSLLDALLTLALYWAP